MTQAAETAPLSNGTELLKRALAKPVEFLRKEFNEANFNRLYKLLIDDNDGLKTETKGKLFGMNKVSIIIKPTDPPSKKSLYDLLLVLESGCDEPSNKDQVSAVKKIRQSIATAFFSTLRDIKDNRSKAGQSTGTEVKPDEIDDTLVAKFIKKLYDAETTDGGKIEAAKRLIPILSTFRDYTIGKHTVSFDSKAAGEEAIKKQIRDAEIGIENEFSAMSAFIGTKSQKVAARAVIMASAATGLYALVAKVGQNPQLSAAVMTGIAAAGPQAVVFAGVFAAVAIAYYAVLKIQDKYAKYFTLIRTMNEFMIVLNKIDRLVRLAQVVSQKYSFDVNLKEIDAQLQILFKRFDKLLSQDDISKIEKELITNPKPDVNAAADSAVTAASNAAIGELNGEVTNASTDQTLNPQGGGGKIGDMMFKLTFDSAAWNQKLNDDVVKLNLYFTTSMTEFSMILNVIQMGLLTSTDPKKKEALVTATTEINESTAYKKMVIGILLNDILKLKVDFSFCNRGGGVFGMTKTTDELVCLENTGVDPAGNRRSLFRERLHELILHLVKVLNKSNSPYDPKIKNEIKQSVVEPYKEMLKAASTDFGIANTALNTRFYLTDAATDTVGLASAKTTLAANPNLQLTGGGNAKPSPARDDQIWPYLKAKPYELVSDDSLTKFLVSVDRFVKTACEPSAKEKDVAAIVANEVAIEIKGIVSVPPVLDSATPGPVIATPPSGGRRLTRKRVLNRRNKKKSHRSKPKVKAQNVV